VKRIAIVGKGTAGSQSAAHFARWFEGSEIVWYFDSSVPVQAVGEGSVLSFPRNLFDNIGFTHSDLKKIDGTFKTGVFKKGWGKGDEFFHDFPPPNVSYHFNAVALQDYVADALKDKVKIKDESVDYRNIDADFVLNASGKPSSYDDFYISDYIPVNAASVFHCEWDEPRFDYTLAIARPYGWVFGVPLQNRCAIGYLYNEQINSEEEVAADVEAVLSEYGLEVSRVAKFSFKNYYRRNNTEQMGRIFHNGNASFFLEPLEATSVGVMNTIQRSATDFWMGNSSLSYAENLYLQKINETETMIMMHYAAGSVFDTPFWNYAKERGIKKIEDSRFDGALREIYTRSVYSASLEKASHEEGYSVWWEGSFIQNVAGLGIKPLMDKFFLAGGHK
jgi:hypothetical protein